MKESVQSLLPCRHLARASRPKSNPLSKEAPRIDRKAGQTQRYIGSSDSMATCLAESASRLLPARRAIAVNGRGRRPQHFEPQEDLGALA